MKVRDAFDVNPVRNSNKYKDFINYIDTSSVNDGRLDNVTYLESDFPSRAQRVVKKYDILYSSVRPNLRHYYLYNDDFEHVVASTGFVLLRKKPNVKIDILFAYYFLRTSEIVKHLSNIAELSQSTFPSFSAKDIAKIDLPDIPYDSQVKIGALLDRYDQLIKQNTSRIQNLEDQASELYKEWFVRFRYPSAKAIVFKESSVGLIPSEFDVLKMKDVVSYYIGGGWGNDNSDSIFTECASVIRGADFPMVAVGDVSTCPLRWHKKSNYKARILKPNDIVLEVSGGTSEQPVGRTILISQSILDSLNNRAICASFCKLVRIKTDVISPLFLCYWLQYVYDTRMIDRFQLQSTGIINFKFEYFLRKGDVLLPPKNVMEEFESNIMPIRDLIEQLSLQNKQAIEQRDSMLPKLLSGRVST